MCRFGTEAYKCGDFAVRRSRESLRRTGFTDLHKSAIGGASIHRCVRGLLNDVKASYGVPQGGVQ